MRQPEDPQRSEYCETSVAHIFDDNLGHAVANENLRSGSLIYLVAPAIGNAAFFISSTSRRDHAGLIWLLAGQPVVAITETSATIQSSAALKFYRGS